MDEKGSKLACSVGVEVDVKEHVNRTLVSTV